MPVIPRARSLSRTPLSPQGPRCFSGFFRARPPPLRAVPAKLARNNRSAAPPCRKTSGFAFASPLRRAGSRAPSAPAPGGRRLTRHSRLRKECEDDEGRSRGRPCSPRGRSARRASRARPRRGSAGARRREHPRLVHVGDRSVPVAPRAVERNLPRAAGVPEHAELPAARRAAPVGTVAGMLPEMLEDAHLVPLPRPPPNSCSQHSTPPRGRAL